MCCTWATDNHFMNKKKIHKNPTLNPNYSPKFIYLHAQVFLRTSCRLKLRHKSCIWSIKSLFLLQIHVTSTTLAHNQNAYDKKI